MEIQPEQEPTIVDLAKLGGEIVKFSLTNIDWWVDTMGFGVEIRGQRIPRYGEEMLEDF